VNVGNAATVDNALGETVEPATLARAIVGAGWMGGVTRPRTSGLAGAVEAGGEAGTNDDALGSADDGPEEGPTVA